MDQHADASDEQQPDAGKRIEQESNIGAKFRGLARLRRIGQVAGVGAQPSVNGLLKRWWKCSGVDDQAEYCHTAPQAMRNASTIVPTQTALTEAFCSLRRRKHDGRAEGGQHGISQMWFRNSIQPLSIQHSANETERLALGN